jgi:hypothetical protein
VRNTISNITYYFNSDSIDYSSDLLKITVRDNSLVSKGHFFGEVLYPVCRLKKNQDHEEWFPLSRRRNMIQDVTGSILLRLCLQV